MTSSPNERAVISEAYESVWDAIEDDLGERARLRLLDELMTIVEDHIKSQGWTQKQAAKHLGVTQPRISDLMRGKISLFSVDSLIGMVGKAGLKLEVSLKSAA